MININLELEKSQVELLVLLLKQITNEQLQNTIMKIEDDDYDSFFGYNRKNLVIMDDNGEVDVFNDGGFTSLIEDIETQYNNKKGLKFRIGQRVSFGDRYSEYGNIVDITYNGKYVIEYVTDSFYGLTEKMTLSEGELLKYNK